MTTEEWLARLEAEGNALNVARNRSATTLKLFIDTKSFTSQKNTAHTVLYDGATHDSADPERIYVTFNTAIGYNTPAVLEINSDGDFMVLSPRRIPYSGGARWCVTNPPSGTPDNWRATNFNFQVTSEVDGTISVSQEGL